MAFTGNVTCNAFKIAQWNAGINFATDTFKVALYDDTATLGVNTAAYTAAGEIAAPGYTPGGINLTVAVQPVADGSVVYASFADAVFSGAFTARGALVYKVGGAAVCVLDFGANKTSTTAFTVKFPAANANSAILRSV